MAAFPSTPVAPLVPMFGLMLGSTESFLVMMAIAFIGWIYNKVTEKGRTDGPPQPPGSRPRPGEGRMPGSQPSIPAARPTRAQMPTPPPVPEVPTVESMFRALFTEPEPGPITTPLSRLDERVEVEAEAPARESLEYARQREEKARALDQSAAAEVAAVVPGPAVLELGRLQPTRARPENRELASVLRRRGSLRQLVVASAVLGRPKSLDEDEWENAKL